MLSDFIILKGNGVKLLKFLYDHRLLPKSKKSAMNVRVLWLHIKKVMYFGAINVSKPQAGIRGRY
jgi:hypothetical protein